MPPKSAPTHFLCIPLVTSVSRSQLAQNLSSFAADVTNPTSFGLPGGAIRPVGTLHLTLGVFSFPKNEGLERATNLLKTLRPQEILAAIKPVVTIPGAEEAVSLKLPEPLHVTLRGLESMQPAAKASVLYAPPADQLGILQVFCERLRSAFQEAELLVEDSRPLLLHATIVNTIYVKAERGSGGDGRHGRGGKGKWRDRLTIDARGILDRYGDHVWMENVRVEKIAICKMGAKKTQVNGVEDEAYEVEAEIDI